MLAIHLLSAVSKWVCLLLDTRGRVQFFFSSLTVFGRLVDSLRPKIEMVILQSYLSILEPDHINLCFGALIDLPAVPMLFRVQ